MPPIRLHDTLTGEVRELEPREPGKVGIYACGPTVYSRIHVGNARAFVVPMLLRRFLAAEGYEPKLVVNLTDVNDKIYDAAREAGVPSAEHARAMTRDYIADTDRLALGRPDAEPLATETIPEIIALIDAISRFPQTEKSRRFCTSIAMPDGPSHGLMEYRLVMAAFAASISMTSFVSSTFA